MKRNDIPYGGYSLEKIKLAEPIINKENLDKYYHYMTERNKIYQRKELSKQKFPWTNDPILRENSFTCCKRWLDRTSKWLIDNISHNMELSYEDRFWRTILFRLYNKIETAEIIGLSNIDFWNNIESAMDNLDNYPNDPFTRAYRIIKLKYIYRDSSNRGHDNWKSSILWHVNNLRLNQKGNIPKVVESNAESTMDWLKNAVSGVGNFIAYQIFIDLTYIPEFPLSEEEFVVSGPGCHAGLKMLFDYKDGLTDEELLFWLRDNIDRIFKEYDSSYDVDNFFYYLDEQYRKWTVMDLENSFCEFSKYIYLLEGRHRRPRKYIPRNS